MTRRPRVIWTSFTALARHIRIDGLGEQLNELLGQIDQALAGISSILPRLVEEAHTVELATPAPRSRRRS